MVVYGEGRYRCPEHGDVRAAAAVGRGPGRGPVRAALPALRPAARWPRPVPEDAPLDPRNVYAATKVAQEHLAPRSRARPARRSPRCATTTSTARGCRATPRTPAWPASSAPRWPPGRAPRVFEDGAQRRDFVHVRDVARANVLALDAASPGVFNVASGTPRTVGEMADALARAIDGPPPGGHRRVAAGDVRHVFASPKRAATVLEFRAEEDFEAGMREFATADLRA